MIRLCEYKLVAAAIQRSGVAREIEQLLSPEGKGRPRGLSVEVFLAGAVLTASRSLPLTFTNIYATLTRELSRSLQVAIGVRVKDDPRTMSRPISIRQVRYLMSAIERRLVYTSASAPELDDALRDARRERFEGIIDQLIGATIPANYAKAVSIAVDGSGVESFAKSKRRAKDVAGAASDELEGEGEDDPAEQDRSRFDHYSADPDARTGYRTRTYDSKSKYNHGYELTAAVAVPRVGGPDIGPKLLLAMRVQPSTTDVTTPAISTLERLLGRGFAIDEVIADRGYSYKKPKDWAEPLRALGLAQVQDIHPADHGPRDAKGVMLIDGVPHCERTPEYLRHITRPAQLSVGPLGPVATEAERLVHARKVADIERFNQLIAERQRYASVRNQGAPEGAKDQAKAQYICAGRAGKLQCALCPYAADYPEGLPVIANPPSGPYLPTSCSQATRVVDGAALIKLAQRDYWGSPEWQASYGRRAHVESIFGNLRNPSTQNIRRGFCRVMGLIKTTLMLAFEVMAANLRLVREWAKRTGENSDPLHEPFPEDFGFEEIDVEGNLWSVAADDPSPPGS